jgi:hypothetical protein
MTISNHIALFLSSSFVFDGPNPAAQQQDSGRAGISS